ncbi:DsbA family protein [Corynebacterium timonense]|uniref:Predicted dithiol-disulfide isomerase, DsbA family n=1 Tax=Corynebacterium timonense TaxID=441500 RepID=A0A1H1LFP2_9CORY|nr:DsbA family protein [Corynebacterium timonense]SDR73130.1 Predicted dithiol-disulfide isomerase, DsbA family [Corynebacterium timonense]
MSTPTIDVYLDYVCPFCFLVEPAIEELKRDRDVQVRVRPFELRPDPVPTLRPEDEYLPRVWRDAVYPMAERVGVPVRLPSVSPQPRTEKAFLVLQLAQEQGLAEVYSRAIFAAFFQDDRDIGDEDVIVDIAETLCMDAASVRNAMSSPERLRQHRADLAHATKAVGVTAVPGIVVNGTLLQGVPSATRLKKAVAQ